MNPPPSLVRAQEKERVPGLELGTIAGGTIKAGWGRGSAYAHSAVEGISAMSIREAAAAGAAALPGRGPQPRGQTTYDAWLHQYSSFQEVSTSVLVLGGHTDVLALADLGAQGLLVLELSAPVLGRTGATMHPPVILPLHTP